MAESIDIVSFDVDTKQALQAVDKYIASLNSLERELVQLQKEGKDTTAVQAQMAAATNNLNRSLQQEVTTTRGVVAQNMALDKSLKSTSATTQRAAVQTDNLGKSNTRGAASFARSVSGAKGLTSALTRTVGGLGNLVGGFGLAGIAINVVSDFLASHIDKLFEASAADKAFAEFKEKASKIVAEESAILNGSIAVLKNSTSTTEERAEAIQRLNQLMPEYINNLDLLKATEEELNIVTEAGTFLLLQKALKSQFDEPRAAANARLAAEELARIKATDGFLAQQRADITSAKAQEALNKSQEEYDKGYKARKEAIKADLADILLQETRLLEAQEFADASGANAVMEAKFLNQEAGKKLAADKAIAAQKDKNRAATASRNRKKEQSDTEVLSGTLAFLEAELAKVNKELTTQTKLTDTQALAKLGAQYQTLTVEIENAKKAIEDVTKAREIDKVEIIQGANIGDIAAENAKFAAQRELADRKEQVEQIELQKQLDLNRLEVVRQSQIKVAQNETAQAIINASNAKQRAELEKKADTEILNARLTVQSQLREIATSSGENVIAIDTEIASLRAELLKLTGEDYSVKIKVDTQKTKEDLKKTVETVAGYVEQFSSIAFSFLNQQSAAQVAAADEAVAKQKSVLDALLNNENTSNAEQVRLEQERLDALNKEREKAKNKEAIIAQAQIAINLALAVARAAAEGGGIASAITIAAAIAAATVGFIAAKQAASQSFYEGTLYAERAPSEQRGRDTINAKINEGEAIIPTATNRQYSDAVAAIYNKTVPAHALNEFVANYGKVDASAKELRNAAKYSSSEYRLIGMAKTDRLPLSNAGNKGEDNTKLLLELFVAELRKNRQSGNKKRSHADNAGKIRARFGVSKG